MDLCHKIADGLHRSATERKWSICVHQCESIADVVKTKIDICVDFIIFTFDTRAVRTLTEVRYIFIQSLIFRYIK